MDKVHAAVFAITGRHLPWARAASESSYDGIRNSPTFGRRSRLHKPVRSTHESENEEYDGRDDKEHEEEDDKAYDDEDDKKEEDDDELKYGYAELDKATFEANIRKRKAASTASTQTHPCSTTTVNKKQKLAPAAKVINGSTLGGKDPLHALIRASGHEPITWTDERQRRARERDLSYNQNRTLRLPRRSSPPSSPSAPPRFLDPAYYDALPKSPPDNQFVSSGLDQRADPETSRSFWAKVSKGWRRSVRIESVRERRRALAEFELRQWADDGFVDDTAWAQ